MHTCFSFGSPFLITQLCPLLCCLYNDKYCYSNECLAHNTVCNDRKTRFGIEMCRALFPDLHAPGHVHLCCNAVVPGVFSFRPCPRAACLSEAHNARPPQPMSSVLVTITLICSKLSHYSISLSHR